LLLNSFATLSTHVEAAIHAGVLHQPVRSLHDSDDDSLEHLAPVQPLPVDFDLATCVAGVGHVLRRKVAVGAKHFSGFIAHAEAKYQTVSATSFLTTLASRRSRR
jgi:hypothetical protein